MKNLKKLFAGVTSNMGIGEPTVRESYDFDVYLSEYGCNLQRPFVWAEENNKSYVEFLYLTGQSINIYLVKYTARGAHADKYDKDNEKYGVLDGKQRLNAILEFLEGKFTILVDGRDFFYSDLYKYDSNCFFYTFTFNVLRDHYLTQKNYIEIFLAINTKGVPQETAHIKELEKLSK